MRGLRVQQQQLAAACKTRSMGCVWLLPWGFFSTHMTDWLIVPGRLLYLCTTSSWRD